MVKVNHTVIKRAGWNVDPHSRTFRAQHGGLLSNHVLDLDGAEAAPVPGQLCTTRAVLSHGVYSQGGHNPAYVLIANPQTIKYKNRDSYEALFKEIREGRERSQEILYSLPFDCAFGSTYQAQCERLPGFLRNDLRELSQYSEPNEASCMNIFVFVRMTDRLRRLAGIRRKKRLFFQMGCFEYVGVSEDRAKLRLRPKKQRPTALKPRPMSPQDESAVLALIALDPSDSDE